jgi:hypothetical protein
MAGSCEDPITVIENLKASLDRATTLRELLHSEWRLPYDLLNKVEGLRPALCRDPGRFPNGRPPDTSSFFTNLEHLIVILARELAMTFEQHHTSLCAAHRTQDRKFRELDAAIVSGFNSAFNPAAPSPNIRDPVSAYRSSLGRPPPAVTTALDQLERLQDGISIYWELVRSRDQARPLLCNPAKSGPPRSLRNSGSWTCSIENAREAQLKREEARITAEQDERFERSLAIWNERLDERRAELFEADARISELGEELRRFEIAKGELRAAIARKEEVERATEAEEMGMARERLEGDTEYQEKMRLVAPFVEIENRIREIRERAAELRKTVKRENARSHAEVLALSAGYRALRRHFAVDLCERCAGLAGRLGASARVGQGELDIARAGVEMLRGIAERYGRARGCQ